MARAWCDAMWRCCGPGWHLCCWGWGGGDVVVCASVIPRVLASRACAHTLPAQSAPTMHPQQAMPPEHDRRRAAGCPEQRLLALALPARVWVWMKSSVGRQAGVGNVRFGLWARHRAIECRCPFPLGCCPHPNPSAWGAARLVWLVDGEAAGWLGCGWLEGLARDRFKGQG